MAFGLSMSDSRCCSSGTVSDIISFHYESPFTLSRQFLHPYSTPTIPRGPVNTRQVRASAPLSAGPAQRSAFGLSKLSALLRCRTGSPNEVTRPARRPSAEVAAVCSISQHGRARVQGINTGAISPGSHGHLDGWFFCDFWRSLVRTGSENDKL